MPTDDFPGAGVLMQNPGALSLKPDAAAGLLWEALAQACRKRLSPWRTPVLATVSPEGAPEARMLVLRGADSQARRLELHSDSRSAKLRSIAAQPLVELCFWDPATQLQLRASGRASAEADSARRESAWVRVPGDSRRNYQSESAPGTALRPHAMGEDANGFANFAILDVEVIRLEWLWLGDVHERGRLLWTGCDWAGELVTP